MAVDRRGGAEEEIDVGGGGSARRYRRGDRRRWRRMIGAEVQKSAGEDLACTGVERGEGLSAGEVRRGG